jgi:hypothetical protein
VLLGPNFSGSWSHWQPLRIRKRIPLSIFRQLATWRPVGFWGQNSTRIGSIRVQRSSGISQRVGRGLGFGFRLVFRFRLVRVAAIGRTLLCAYTSIVTPGGERRKVRFRIVSNSTVPDHSKRLILNGANSLRFFQW